MRPSMSRCGMGIIVLQGLGMLAFMVLSRPGWAQIDGSPGAPRIADALIDRTTPTLEMDINTDGAIDVADVVTAANGVAAVELMDTSTRFAAMESAGAKFTELSAQYSGDWVARNAAFVAWAQTVPEFKSAGSFDEDGTAWAIFTDGVPALFVDNFEPAAGSAPALTAQRGDVALPPLKKPLDRASLQLRPDQVPEVPDDFLLLTHAGQPFSQAALVSIGINSGFQTYGVFEELAERIAARGYQTDRLNFATQPSVQDYINADEIGVLLLNGHSAKGKFEQVLNNVEGIYFGINIPIPLDEAEFARWEATEVAAKRLVPMFSTLDQVDGQDVDGWTWAITDQFVIDHWNFSPNSLVILHACNSGLQFVREIFTSKGAAVVFAWNGLARDDSSTTIRHIVKRALGNEITAQWDSSPVRPFDLYSVDLEARRKGLLPDPDGIDLVASRRIESTMATLAPSIRTIRVHNGTGELHLHGLFGEDPGPAERSVTLGGSPVNVKTWDRWVIICDLPEGTGPVVVTKRGIASNPLPLTGYSGSMDWRLYTNELGTYASGQISFNFRIDISPFRFKPDQEPLYLQQLGPLLDPNDPETLKYFVRFNEQIQPPASSAEAGDSFSFGYGGSFQDSACANPGTISGGGSLAAIPVDPNGSTSANPSSGMLFRPILTADEVTLEPLMGWLIVVNGATGSFTSGCPPQEPVDTEIVDVLFDVTEATALIGADYSLLGDTYTKPLSSSGFGFYNSVLELTWSTLSPSGAPVPGVTPSRAP